METIGENDSIDIVLLNIDVHFGMEPKMAQGASLCVFARNRKHVTDGETSVPFGLWEFGSFGTRLLCERETNAVDRTKTDGKKMNVAQIAFSVGMSEENSKKHMEPCRNLDSKLPSDSKCSNSQPADN